MKFYSDGPVRVAVIPGLAKEMLDAGSDWYLNDAESWFNPKSLNG